MNSFHLLPFFVPTNLFFFLLRIASPPFPLRPIQLQTINFTVALRIHPKIRINSSTIHFLEGTKEALLPFLVSLNLRGFLVFFNEQKTPMRIRQQY
ncbi:hypothetical protein F5Y11DRAFT_66353 [Daldinia sp. FL1419]|nr:hypothetical protein F5Y11DRAFT_66353 [Daldinia sp. FL1419]